MREALPLGGRTRGTECQAPVWQAKLYKKTGEWVNLRTEVELKRPFPATRCVFLKAEASFTEEWDTIYKDAGDKSTDLVAWVDAVLTKTEILKSRVRRLASR